jgi:integrase
MLYRLVRSVKRRDSSQLQFAQRIPADVRPRAGGLKLAIPLGGGEFHHITISPKANAVRFSLRTREPSEAKVRQGHAATFLESVWQGLRATKPLVLSHRQATALAGELYRAWASERPEERTIAIELRLDGSGWDRVPSSPAEEQAGFSAIAASLATLHDAAPSDLEPILGALVDRLLLARGITAVEPHSRELLLAAFALALQDALENRARNAAGDYSPDPKAGRFPEWQAPESDAKPEPAPVPKQSLKALVEDWWLEAKATGRKLSTYESYRNTMAALIVYLGHDDAGRLTPGDVIGFKDHRLASTNPRTGKPLSAKTVKDSDLAGLKTVFGWAVANRRMASNPAAGITIKLGKPQKLRSKSLSDKEAQAILGAALAYLNPAESAKTVAAKRWVPWLCAYTGARVGELAQLRKQDLRQEGGHWVLHITPEAGTVKTNEARDVVLHSHLVELGFPAFVASAPAGHLFLKIGKEGEVRGPLRGLKNRLAEFGREHVKDPNVAPNHGWRHRFKTVGLEAGIDHRVLDAIQGQSPRSVAESYGEVTVRTMAAAMAKIPRVETSAATNRSPDDAE